MFPRRLTRRSKQNARQTAFRRCVRRGIATVETAILLPLVVFLTFGSIEIANAIFVRESMVVAAYEGARAVSQPSGTEATCKNRIKEILTARGITSYNVSITPSVDNSTPRGTQIAVRVSVTNAVFTYSPFRLFTGKTVEHTTTMVHQ